MKSFPKLRAKNDRNDRNLTKTLFYDTGKAFWNNSNIGWLGWF